MVAVRLPLGQLSRWFVLLSAASGITAGVLIASSLWAWLPATTLIAFVATFAIARLWPSAALPVMLLPACLLPAVVRQLAGGFDPAHVLLWLASLLGGILGLSGLRDWVLPRLWRLLLVHGALCVALASAIVAGRELDWTTEFLKPGRIWVTAQGIHPRVALIWVAYIATAQLVVLLWVDVLVGWYRKDKPASLERYVIWPVVLSASLGAAAGIVQMFWDIDWMNSRMFAFLGRASGLLLDANSMGMTAALGAAAAIALALRETFTVRALAAGAAVVSLAAVWGSGSRTAFMVALVVLGVTCVVLGARALQARARRELLAAAILLTAIVLAGLALRGGAETVGPLARVTDWLSDPAGQRTVSSTISELWKRDGYGLAAVAMIGHYPWTGVGPGMFHLMVLDYTFLIHYPVMLPTDNAQNWLRHHLAETGVLGSLGWALWAILFPWWIARSRVWRDPAGAVLSAALIALGAVSLVSLPTQNPAVLIMAATLVFWLWVLADEPARLSAPGWRAWGIVWAAAIVFAAATFWIARTELRVPYRAVRAGWAYSHGLYALESPAGGAFRWTRQHAVTVFPARDGYLRLRFWVRHPDVAERPVDVEIRFRDQTIVKMRLTDKNPVERYVHVPPGRSWLMLETRVSRTFTATDGGRELGLALSDWTFVPRVPEGGVMLNPVYDY